MTRPDPRHPAVRLVHWGLAIGVLLYFAIGKVGFESRLAIGDLSLNTALQPVVLICLLLVLEHGGASRLLRSRGFWLVVAVTALLWIGTVHSQNVAYKLQKPLGYAGIVLPCQALLVAAVRDREGVRRILLLWTGLGTLLMLAGLALLLAGAAPARLAVLGGGANVFARMVASAALIALGLELYVVRRGHRWLVGVCIVAVATTLLFAGSKTAVLALGIGVMALGAYTARRKLVVAAAALTAAFLIAPTWVHPVFERADKDRGAVRMFRLPDTDDPRGSYGTRLQYYRDSLLLLRTDGWLGVGTGDWSVALHGPSGRRYPHNLWLEMGCEQGLAGWLTLGLLLALGGRWAMALRNPPGDRRLAGTVFALWTFWLVNAQFSGDLLDNRHIWWPVLLLEILWIERRSPRDRETVRAGVRPEMAVASEAA